jgi:hypothetical protein
MFTHEKFEEYKKSMIMEEKDEDSDDDENQEKIFN